MSAIGIKGTVEKTEISLNNLDDNIKKNKAKYNKKLWNKKDKNLEKSLDKSTNKNIIKKEKVVIKNKNKYEKKEKAEKAEEYKISIPKPFNRNLQTKKDGWCYIGKDKTGIQCAKVKDIYKCMSGNIYPTREMCINPLLRK